MNHPLRPSYHLLAAIVAVIAIDRHHCHLLLAVIAAATTAAVVVITILVVEHLHLLQHLVVTIAEMKQRLWLVAFAPRHRSLNRRDS